MAVITVVFLEPAMEVGMQAVIAVAMEAAMVAVIKPGERAGAVKSKTLKQVKREAVVDTVLEAEEEMKAHMDVAMLVQVSHGTTAKMLCRTVAETAVEVAAIKSVLPEAVIGAAMAVRTEVAMEGVTVAVIGAMRT